MFVVVGHGEQGIEVLEDLAKPLGVERFAGHAIDLGLHTSKVVLEQPEVSLFQGELGPNRLEAGATVGDGIDQAIHLLARLFDAAAQNNGSSGASAAI